MVTKYALDLPTVPSLRMSKNRPLIKARRKTSFFLITTEAKIIINRLSGRVIRVDSSKIEIARKKAISFIPLGIY